MVSLEDIYWERKSINNSNLPSVYAVLKIEGGKTLKAKKNLTLCGTIGDLEKLGQKIEIRNGFGQIFRTITIKKENIIFDAGMGKDEILTLPKSLPIYYEEWFMDRGSYVFVWNYKGKETILKLATEYDPIFV